MWSVERFVDKRCIITSRMIPYLRHKKIKDSHLMQSEIKLCRSCTLGINWVNRLLMYKAFFACESYCKGFILQAPMITLY